MMERIPQPVRDSSRFALTLSSACQVVVAVHNACVGGGVDLITACDIRLCSEDAWFSIREVDIGNFCSSFLSCLC